MFDVMLTFENEIHLNVGRKSENWNVVLLTVFSLTSLVREMLKDLREVSQYAKWAFALTTKFITYTLYRWIFANLSVTILQTSIPI